MIAIDLFCKAGGASEGLVNAGFSVIGVDIEPQPNYPYDFVQSDVFDFYKSHQKIFKEAGFIWASPPCQAFTAYKRSKNVKDSPNLIPQTRNLLSSLSVPYVIENVVGAPLRADLMLCGSMFGLDVKRHRIFELNFKIDQPRCNHSTWTPRFAPASNRVNLRKTVEVGVYRIPIEIQKKAMGINRKITLSELSNAIPPQYSEYIGKHLFTKIIKGENGSL